MNQTGWSEPTSAQETSWRQQFTLLVHQRIRGTFLQKPFTPRNLNLAVREVFGRKRQTEMASSCQQ